MKTTAFQHSKNSIDKKPNNFILYQSQGKEVLRFSVRETSPSGHMTILQLCMIVDACCLNVACPPGVLLAFENTDGTR